MTIENLIKAVPPPTMPLEPFSGPWGVIEADLGTLLPQDYKEFAQLYGSGFFMDFLGVHIPNTQNPHTRLEWQAAVISDLFANNYIGLTYPLWPNLDGLLSLGVTTKSDFLFWLTRGPPEEWGIIVWDRKHGDFETFDLQLTDFLAGLVTGHTSPKGFPAGLPSREPLFQPAPAFVQEATKPGVGVSLSWRTPTPSVNGGASPFYGDGREGATAGRRNGVRRTDA